MSVATMEKQVTALTQEVARMKDAILQLAFTLQQLSKDIQNDTEDGGTP